ncbi:hypothetical protein GCM10020367_18260 [Streptomyces sannanensis]|uniref:VOC domain-containing protein n=1 Tax=Streptomyces sannanensis TaxID=285536 RepID=A0ABP6S8I7_9ACTN
MLDRIKAAGVTYFADPSHTEPGQVNDLFGGRGVYFDDPDGHNMEIATRPCVRPYANRLSAGCRWQPR